MCMLRGEPYRVRTKFTSFFFLVLQQIADAMNQEQNEASGSCSGERLGYHIRREHIILAIGISI